MLFADFKGVMRYTAFTFAHSPLLPFNTLTTPKRAIAGAKANRSSMFQRSLSVSIGANLSCDGGVRGWIFSVMLVALYNEIFQMARIYLR